MLTLAPEQPFTGPLVTLGRINPDVEVGVSKRPETSVVHSRVRKAYSRLAAGFSTGRDLNLGCIKSVGRRFGQRGAQKALYGMTPELSPQTE